MARQAWGEAIVTVTQAGAVLDYFYPDPRLGPPVEVVSGVLAAECAALLRDFFRPRR